MHAPNRRQAGHGRHYNRHPWSVRVLDPANANQVSDADPLAIWTDEPAVSRLNFANLHYSGQGGG